MSFILLICVHVNILFMDWDRSRFDFWEPLLSCVTRESYLTSVRPSFLICRLGEIELTLWYSESEIMYGNHLSFWHLVATLIIEMVIPRRGRTTSRIYIFTAIYLTFAKLRKSTFYFLYHLLTVLSTRIHKSFNSLTSWYLI